MNTVCEYGGVTGIYWGELYGGNVGVGRVRDKMSKMKGCGACEREWWRNNGLNFDSNKLGGLVFFYFFVLT